jgi:hypothetical protein
VADILTDVEKAWCEAQVPMMAEVVTVDSLTMAGFRGNRATEVRKLQLALLKGQVAGINRLRPHWTKGDSGLVAELARAIAELEKS